MRACLTSGGNGQQQRAGKQERYGKGGSKGGGKRHGQEPPPSGQGQFNLVMLWCAAGFDMRVLSIRADDGAVAKELAELRGLLKKQS